MLIDTEDWIRVRKKNSKVGRSIILKDNLWDKAY